MNSEETESYLSSIEEYVFDEKKIACFAALGEELMQPNLWFEGCIIGKYCALRKGLGVYTPTYLIRERACINNIFTNMLQNIMTVTYSWLSKTLGLHFNVSKQLLHTFYQNNPKKGELCATYLLIGVSNNGGSCQVLIVKDKDLQEVESSLKTVTSKHIYSVQKCLELSGLDILYAAQKEDNMNTITKGLSSIDFNCIERDSTLIEKLRFNALPTLSSGFSKKTNPPPSNSINKSPTNISKDDQSIKNTSYVGNKESEIKKESEKVVVPSMFKNNTAPKKKTSDKAASSCCGNKKNSKGIGAFFSKTSKAINEPKAIVDEKQPIEKELDTIMATEERLSPLKENKATLNISDQSKSNSKTNDSPVEALIKTKKEDTKPNKRLKKNDSKRTGNKKNITKKVKNDDKKRKRLVVLSDSDSSNASEDEDEVQREPTPEPEPMIVPDNEDEDIIYGTPEPSKKRKKKLVSKTFMSPDGYMVTEKQMVEASGSEDEGVPEKKLKQNPTDDEPLAKKNNSVNDSKLAKSSSDKNVSVKNKTNSPQKTKQVSLMNFFKKK